VYEASLDAEHCLLLVLSKASYFITRSADPKLPTVLSVDDSNSLFPVKGSAGAAYHDKTLLDGELVFNYFYNKTVFYIHDTIAINNRQIHSLSLPKRLEAFAHEVIQPLRQKYPTPDLEQASLPFIVMGKELVPLDKGKSIIEKVSRFPDASRGIRFLYENGKRYNENKGFVFVNETLPYDPSQRFLWLWPELCTVVFRATFTDPSSCPILSLSLPGSTALSPYVNLSSSSSKLLHQQLRAGSPSSPSDFDDLAVDVSCIHFNGQFHYLHLAPEGSKPDSFPDVMQYLEDVTTNLYLSDIEKLIDRIVEEKSLNRRRTSGDLTPGRNNHMNASSPPQLSSHHNIHSASSPLVLDSPDSSEVIYDSPINPNNNGSNTLSNNYNLHNNNHNNGNAINHGKRPLSTTDMAQNLPDVKRTRV